MTVDEISKHCRFDWSVFIAKLVQSSLQPGFNSLAEVYVRKFYVYDHSTVMKTRKTVSSPNCFRNMN